MKIHLNRKIKMRRRKKKLRSRCLKMVSLIRLVEKETLIFGQKRAHIIILDRLLRLTRIKADSDLLAWKMMKRMKLRRREEPLSSNNNRGWNSKQEKQDANKCKHN
jgi:hypothetical protein